MVCRIRYSFTGRVQGVGFRATAQHLAELLGVTGWVRNETDGSVTMEAQGERDQIESLIIRLQSGGGDIAVTGLCFQSVPVVQNERVFIIDRRRSVGPRCLQDFWFLEKMTCLNRNAILL